MIANYKAPLTLMIGAASALGLMAFACTVTTAPTPTDGSSSGTPSSSGNPTTTPSDSGAANACPGNTHQQKDLVSADCQSCLTTNCCTQLTNCFDIQASGSTDDGGVATDTDCNGYSDCIAFCIQQNTDVQNCEDECNQAAAPGVTDAYNAIVDCEEANATCKPLCEGS